MGIYLPCMYPGVYYVHLYIRRKRRGFPVQMSLEGALEGTKQEIYSYSYTYYLVLTSSLAIKGSGGCALLFLLDLPLNIPVPAPSGFQSATRGFLLLLVFINILFCFLHTSDHDPFIVSGWRFFFFVCLFV